MQRNAVQCKDEAETIPRTLWAYVPSRYDTPRPEEPKSSTLFASFCCCFTNEDSPHPQSEVSVHFSMGDDPPITLSQALLCLDNPQMPSDLVSYPISEDIILAEHRSQNVLQEPPVIRSTQMFFMGYDIASLKGIDIHQRRLSSESGTSNSDS